MKTLTDSELIMYLLIIIAIEAVIRITEVNVSPQSARRFRLGSEEDNYFYLECKSTQISAFVISSFVYKGLIVLASVYLAVAVRNIDRNFNESVLLGVIIYHMRLGKNKNFTSQCTHPLTHSPTQPFTHSLIHPL